ncbi:MAG: GntR family transcriptional regulator [Burkholderiales bacterium]
MRTGPALTVIQGSLAGISPVETGTLGQRVYGGLRDYLMAGQLQPGQKLTLRELATALNVSPMPVREAVRRLCAEGALEMLPNRRIRVPVVTKSRFRELLRIRVAVEGLAVEEAARRIRMDDVDRMEALNREFAAEMQRRQADGVKLFRINKDIHFLLYEAAGMPMLLPVIEGLWLQIGPVLHLSLRMRANANARGKNPAPNWHKRMILGLRKRDAAAARRGLVGDMTSAADQILAEGNLPD